MTPIDTGGASHYKGTIPPSGAGGTPRPHYGASITVAYAPRRTVLDKILVDAADQPAPRSGRGFAVDEIPPAARRRATAPLEPRRTVSAVGPPASPPFMSLSTSAVTQPDRGRRARSVQSGCFELDE
jgi:hypothetical protein